MISPDTISKSSTGLVTFYVDGVVAASCKDTCVIQPITFGTAQKSRGFRVFTGAPPPTAEDIRLAELAAEGTGKPPRVIRYDIIDFDINELTVITAASTTYNYTPPNTLQPSFDQSAYNSAYNGIYVRLVTSVFQGCCPTIVNVTGEAILFYATYADLPSPGLVDILYVVEDGSGAYIWDSTLSSYVPVYYGHASLSVYAYQNFT